MAKYGVTNIAGGGGIGSDEVSVTKEYVLNSKTYVGSDTNDEIGTGTMANNGATGNQSLNAGGSFSVKKGYHAQDFTVNANSLASQTLGNAIPSHVLNGETYWTNGNKLTGTMNVQSILSFSCAPYSASQIIFTWQNPSSGPFSGVIIVGKTGGYPANINDGLRYYKGFGNNTNSFGISNTIIGGFGVNNLYYFKAFSYTTINNQEWTSNTSLISNTIINLVTRVFTSSTTFTVPSNVNKIDLFSVGGGGNGGRRTEKGSNEYTGGGGGGGYTTTLKDVNVSPNSTIQIIVGAGESSSYFVINNIQKCIAKGGGRGGDSHWPSAGAGGSGGGAPGWIGTGGSNPTIGGGSGGSNGNNGETLFGGSDGGFGQGTTTRAFGESTGTLYAGGGGGGAMNAPGGAGGTGGGGKGGGNWSSPVKPTPNTGGGGGGQGEYYGDMTNSGGASGICLIRCIG